MVVNNIIIASIVAVLIIVSAALLMGTQIIPNTQTIPKIESACNIDADCACGTSLITNDCAYGNAAFINVSVQCPDFCNGIAANLEIKCENKTCVQKQTPEFACRANNTSWNGTACECKADMCAIPEMAVINGQIVATCENNKCGYKTVCNSGYIMTDEGCTLNATQACIASGGNVTSGLACKSASDFPNSCAIGPFGCSPDNSHEVQACECADGKCWNGEKCACDAMRCPLPLIYINNGNLEAYCNYSEQCATRTVCDSGYMLVGNMGCEMINSTMEGKACIAAGGNVTTGTACKSVDSFPNTCATGSQGCSADNSHAVSVCECPAEQCWNGSTCAAREIQYS